LSEDAAGSEDVALSGDAVGSGDVDLLLDEEGVGAKDVAKETLQIRCFSIKKLINKLN